MTEELEQFVDKVAPKIQVVSWNDKCVDSVKLNRHAISLLSFNLTGEKRPHWWQLLSAVAGRAAPLPVTRQWHFVKQDKVIRALAPDSHILFLNIFLSMWFACWKLIADHTYVWSIHTSVYPPQNGENILEYQTLKKKYFRRATTVKSMILSSDCPGGLCIIDFIPAGEQRLLQYSDYRAGEINWTN